MTTLANALLLISQILTKRTEKNLIAQIDVTVPFLTRNRFKKSEKKNYLEFISLEGPKFRETFERLKNL